MNVSVINTPSTTVESTWLLQHLLMYFHNISSWNFAWNEEDESRRNWMFLPRLAVVF